MPLAHPMGYGFEALSHGIPPPRRPLCEAQGERVSTSLAVGISRATGEGREGQQGEIHLHDRAQNAWAKADALLICGNCYDDGEGDILLMVAEPADEDEAA